MSGVNNTFIHVYDDGDYCIRKSDSKIYNTTKPSSGSSSGGSGGSDNNYSDEEKQKLASVIEGLSSHVEDKNNPHEVKISQIEGLSSKLNNLDAAIGTITPETIQMLQNLIDEYDENTTIVQTTVVNTLTASSGQGTTVEKNEDNTVSLNINVAEEGNGSLTFVETPVTDTEGNPVIDESTGEQKTKSELALGWVEYSDNSTPGEEGGLLWGE